MKECIALLKKTCADFSNDNASRMAAALAYYTIFSLAPLLVIAISIAGLVFTYHGASEQISLQIRGLLGDAGAIAVQSMVQSAMQPKKSTIAVIVGAVTLLFGASGVFAELQSALNNIWKVPTTESSGFCALIKNRFLSFAAVLGFGFLLLVSLVISAAITAITTMLHSTMPAFQMVAEALNFVVSVLVSAALFAMIFKILPETKIAWRDVLHGAFATSFFFSIGKFLLGLYLGRSALVSSYGAAGSVAMLLLWVYYSSMILLFGAEFTHVYSRHHGTRAGD